MFLEGQIDWVLVLGVVAAAASLIAIVAVWFAFTNGARHSNASTELDLVQKVAESADKRLMQTLNAIPVALVETDKQGKFVFANRAAHQLLGRKDAELIGLRFHSATWGITYPDGKPVPPDLLPSARALRGQTVKGFQHLLANATTRRKMTVSVTAMPIEDEHGRIIGSTAAIVETEGLMMPEPAYVEPAYVEPAPVPEPAFESAPAADDSLVRRVFEAASSALIVVGTDGVIREANATALRVLGRDIDVAGQDFADLFLAEDARVEGRQALRAALNAPAGDAEPITAHDPDGGGVLWRILPLGGETGSESGADALLLAGERWETEAEAELAPEIVPEIEAAEPVVDEAAIQARIDAAVAAALAERAEIEAAEPEPAETESASGALRDAEAQAQRDAQARALAEAEADAQARIDAALAEAAEARARIAEVEAAEQTARAAADQARQDVEAARRSAQRAQADAEAELAGGRRMESVGRLTGGVAHDFNALLGVMTSALDMILRQADDPSRVKRLGEAALAAGQRGEILTRKLTAFSQGEDEPALQTLDAGVLLKAMETRLRAQAGPGVDLMIEGPSEAAPARLDPVAFEGAVKALVANAVEAVDGQGSVAVRLESLMEGGLRLSVRDTGPGMDRELATRALEPFFTTKPGASGLGLSQAYAFARQSAGVLSIDSAAGEGAEVAITLPSAA